MSDIEILIFGMIIMWVNVYVFFIILKDRIERIEINSIKSDGDIYETKLTAEYILKKVYSIKGEYLNDD